MIGSLWIEGCARPGRLTLRRSRSRPLSSARTAGSSSKGAFASFKKRRASNCHLIEGHGGERGPDLTYIGDKLPRTI